MTEAVVLVGGLGTRLRPLTARTPKPMLPTAGVPFLAHMLSRLRASGIEHVVLATAYHPEVFTEGLGAGEVLGLEIDYCTESEPLGTGGAIRNATSLLRSAPGDPVVVLNGDVLSGHDIARQVRVHLAAGAEATLHLTEVADARPFGSVPTDADGRVTAFLEKSPVPVTNRVNAGCYVFRRGALDTIPTDRPISVERETFPALLTGGALVLGHLDPCYWIDVGTPGAFVQSSCDLVLGRLRSAALPAPPGERLLLPGAMVAADAAVTGGTTVGAGASVASAATVHASVLLDGAQVGPGAWVRGSVLGVGARVGEGTVLDGVVLGDGAVVGAGNELLAGARVWTDVTIPDRAVRFSSDQPPA